MQCTLRIVYCAAASIHRTAIKHISLYFRKKKKKVSVARSHCECKPKCLSVLTLFRFAVAAVEVHFTISPKQTKAIDGLFRVCIFGFVNVYEIRGLRTFAFVVHRHENRRQCRFSSNILNRCFCRRIYLEWRGFRHFIDQVFLSLR